MAKAKVYAQPSQWILDHVLMDSTLSASFQTRLDLAKSKFETDCIVNHDGGIFNADQNLVSFLHSMSVIYKNGTCCLLDSRGIPVKIQHTKDFFNLVLETYDAAAREYHGTVSSIIESRSKEV